MSEAITTKDSGWKTYKFGACAKLINGRAYSQHELLSSGQFQVIRIQNLNGGSNWYFSNLQLEDEKYCVDGDLLFAWSATFGPYVWRGARAIFHYHIWNVKTNSKLLDKEFAYYLLLFITEEIRSAAHGIAMLHFTKEGMESHEVSIPPLPLQRQIATRLKAQLAEVETARQAAQVQLNEATALKTKVLESLFSSIPDWAPIGDAAKLQSGYAFKSDSFKTSGVRLLRNANILPGKVYWDDAVFLSETDSVKHPSYALNAGDVLISLDRPIIASGIKVARVGAGDLPALLVQRVGRLLIDPQKLDADYLYAYLQTDLFISKISGHDQSLGVPHISPSQVEAIEMPLPDISVQRELSKQLNEVTRTWQVALAAMQSQASELSKLPKAILAQAFNPQGE